VEQALSHIDLGASDALDDLMAKDAATRRFLQTRIND
jgi:hypothetical protein